MEEKLYTVGEIFRLGLLKNHHGEPYKHKATILQIVRRLPHARTETPWGTAYAISAAEIEKFNARRAVDNY